MTSARHRLYRRALKLCLVLGLGPGVAAAAQDAAYAGLSPSDTQLAQATLQETLETQPSAEIRLWRNEATGRSGSVMPLRTFRIKSGHFCREYRETVLADGTMTSRSGTACRADDGAWIAIER